jgi:PII-like signaling protein
MQGQSAFDALRDVFTSSAVRASAIVLGAEGFGRSRRVRTDRSEAGLGDLPVMVVAVDSAARIASVGQAIRELLPGALITVASTEVIFRTAEAATALATGPAELTVYGRWGYGRDDAHGIGGIFGALRHAGVAGATALGWGDGSVAGVPLRRRPLSRVGPGPIVTRSVDSAAVLARVVPSLLRLPQVDVMTIKPVGVHERNAPPPHGDFPGGVDAFKLTLYMPEGEGGGWRPGHVAFASRLRREPAAGLTVVRAIMGFRDEHPVRPDTGWLRRRRAPLVHVVVDSPDRSARWIELADEVRGRRGLVTYEPVVRI